MKNIILAWLNANATNEARAKEIEYWSEKFAIEFMNWCINNYHTDGRFTGILDDKELLEIYKKEKEL